MKTTKIIAGLLVSALLSTTGVFAADTTATGITTPTPAKVSHTKKVVKKTTLTAAQKTAMAKKVAAKKVVAKKVAKKVAAKKVIAKKVAKKVAVKKVIAKKVAKKTSSIKK